jgi:hypothetical protein
MAMPLAVFCCFWELIAANYQQIPLPSSRLAIRDRLQRTANGTTVIMQIWQFSRCRSAINDGDPISAPQATKHGFGRHRRGKLLIWTPKKQTISFAAGMATWE